MKVCGKVYGNAAIGIAALGGKHKQQNNREYQEKLLDRLYRFACLKECSPILEDGLNEIDMVLNAEGQSQAKNAKFASLFKVKYIILCLELQPVLPS